MALASSAILTQYDLQAAGNVREDLSDVVSAVLKDDTNLLSRIGIGGAATNITHSWLEESLNPTTVTDDETGGLDAAGANVDLVLSSGQGARVRIGTLLRDNTRGKTEILLVTAISTDTLTVTRGYGSSSAEAHAQASTWTIVGRPQQSGADVPSDRSTTRSLVSNFCQIFMEAPQVSGDAQAVTKAGVPDELAHQTAMRLKEQLVELNIAIIQSYKSASGGSDSVYRSMGGLIEFLTAGGNTNSTAEAITPDVINDMVQQVYDDGGAQAGSSLVLACGQTQMRKISAFDKDKIMVTPGPGISGRYVYNYLSDLNVSLPIVLDRNIPTDVSMILDLSRIKVVPLQGRAFGVEPLPKDGDRIRNLIIGDYTLEVRNASQAHAIHTNLSIS